MGGRVLPKSIESLEREARYLRNSIVVFGCALERVTAQRDKYIHKYRKLCKHYHSLCLLNKERRKKTT